MRGENESDKMVEVYSRNRCRRASGLETEGHPSSTSFNQRILVG